MIVTLNNELIKLSNWIKSNQLTINISKTFYMVSSATNTILGNINIKVDNHTLSKVEKKGVNIDEKLTSKPHLTTFY